jgi:basic amino acid/polyamine antiporter, APA family
MLFPGIKGAALYHLLGEDVTTGSLVLGLSVTVLLAVLNILGTHLTARFQETITYVRLGLMGIFLCVALIYANPQNLSPLIGNMHGGVTFNDFVGVVVTSPILFVGFSVFAAASEERSATSTDRSVGYAIILSILGAAAFYCLLVLAIGSLVPWQQLPGLSLPAASAFKIAMGSAVMMKIVLLTACLGILTAWNAMLIAGTRVLFALGRARLASGRFERLHARHGTPAAAILFITAICMLAAFLGRGFIIPIVNISTAGFAATYLITCLALFRLQYREPEAGGGFTVPGGKVTIVIAAAGAAGILLAALLQPFFSTEGKPLEWLIIAVWFAIAGFFWFLLASHRNSVSENERWELLRGADR